MLVVPTDAAGWVMLAASCGWGPGGLLEMSGPLRNTMMMVLVMVHRGPVTR
jgi:hypothetical protein